MGSPPAIPDQDGSPSIKSLFYNRERRKLPSLIRTYSEEIICTVAPVHEYVDEGRIK